MAETQSKATKTGNGTKTMKQQDADDFETQIASLKEELAKVKAQLASSGERSLDAARKAARGGVSQLREQGEAAMDDLRANARDLETQLVNRVREKPVTALAVAAGVGFLFALIASR